MRACVIIPARYASTRFPGKPLVSLLDRPMVLWVAELSAKAVGKDHVYVATEDNRIAAVVRRAGFNVLMTSAAALTGTDRLAEAARMINYDIYVNVQGDEPIVDPADIVACIEKKQAHPDFIMNGYCWIDESEDPANRNIPKVITDEAGRMIYMSRVALPGYKEVKNAPTRYMKQVCIYGFSREDLVQFSAFGRKSYLETCEDIEILRFLELGREIMMYECRPGSIAVDVQEDVAHVEAALRKKRAQ